MDEPLRIPVEADGAQRAAQELDAVRDALLRMAAASEAASSPSFVERWAAYSTAISSSVANVRTAIGAFESVAGTIADLATEQERLTRNSARIGVDFDAAATAAGRFADETTAMAAATRLFEAGTRVSQEQLNALMRVAGEFSQTTGVTMDQAVTQLTQGLIAGSERGLRPFGAEMLAVAGHAHTTEERLAALVSHAGRVEAATDTARDRMERFRDSIGDQMRSAASTFVERLAAIDERANALNATIDTTRSETAELGVTLTDVADTAARAFSLMASSVGFALVEVKNSVLDVVDGLRLAAQITANPLNAAEAVEAWTARAAGREAQNQSWANRIGAALEGDPESRMTDGPRSGGPDAAGGGATPRASEEAERERNRAYAQQGHLQQAQLEKDRRARERAGRGGRRGSGTRHEADNAEAQMRAARRENQRAQAYRNQATPAADALAAMDEAVAQKANDSAEASDEEAGRHSYDRFARDRSTTRRDEQERRSFEQRYEAARTFTERWEDLHERQVIAAQEAAESLQAAFKGIGDALGEHIVAFAEGKEDVEDALQGVLSSTLGSLSKEAQAKGSFYAAEALGLLVAGNFPGAATAAAASAAYFTAAGVGAYLASETKPGADKAADTKGASGRSGGGPRNERLGGDINARGLGSDAPTIVNNYYAPVIGGRESTAYETGARVSRFTDASSRRQVRARS